MFVEYMALFLMFMLLCAFVCAVVCIPIMIANGRGICGNHKLTIVILSWLGIFFGVTWVVALILSLAWTGTGRACDACCGRLDQLERLSKLYQSKVLSRAEYEKMKAKLLKDN